MSEETKRKIFFRNLAKAAGNVFFVIRYLIMVFVLMVVIYTFVGLALEFWGLSLW